MRRASRIQKQVSTMSTDETGRPLMSKRPRGSTGCQTTCEAGRRRGRQGHSRLRGERFGWRNRDRSKRAFTWTPACRWTQLTSGEVHAFERLDWDCRRRRRSGRELRSGQFGCPTWACPRRCSRESVALTASSTCRQRDARGERKKGAATVDGNGEADWEGNCRKGKVQWLHRSDRPQEHSYCIFDWLHL